MMIERSARTDAVGGKLSDKIFDELPQRRTAKFVHSSAPLDAGFLSEDLRRMVLLHGCLEGCGKTWFDGEKWLR